MNTLNSSQASEFLKIHPVTLLEMARAGEVPGAKIGKSWVFIDDDLADYVRSKYNNPGKRIVVETEDKCLLREKVVKIGTSNSASAEKQYTSLLAPATKKKRSK